MDAQAKRPRKVVGSPLTASSTGRTTPSHVRRPATNGSTIVPPPASFSARTARSPTVGAPLKAKVDLSDLPVPSTLSSGLTKSKAASDAGSMLSVRAKATPGLPGLGSPPAKTLPPSLGGGPHRPPGSIGLAALSPPLGGAPLVSAVPFGNVTRRSHQRDMRSSDDLTARYARGSSFSESGKIPGLPLALRPDAGESPNQPKARRLSTSGASTLSACQPGPSSRSRNDSLLPSPAIPDAVSARASVPSSSGIGRRVASSRPGSPLHSPAAGSFATADRPLSVHPSSHGPSGGIWPATSPPKQSSGSSTLSGGSGTNTRRSASGSSSTSMDESAIFGISGRLDRTENKGWLESEAERLQKIEREEVEAELKGREDDAKVNRKIMDLEISNASLLAVNATLERTKLKQTAEIRELRRRMRERSLAPISTISPGLLSPPPSDEPAPSEDSDEEVDFDTLMREDTKFADVARLLEALLRRATEAVQYQPTDKDLASKVLNSVEMEDKLAEEEARTSRLRPPEPEAATRQGRPRSSGAGEGSSRAVSVEPGDEGCAPAPKPSRDAETQTDVPPKLWPNSPRLEVSPSSSPAQSPGSDGGGSGGFAGATLTAREGLVALGPSCSPSSTSSSAGSSVVSAHAEAPRFPVPAAPPRSAGPHGPLAALTSRRPASPFQRPASRPGSRASSPSVKVLAGRFRE